MSQILFERKYIMPLIMTENRTLIRKLPPAYNEDVSPYSQMKDFPRLVRYELEVMQRKFKLRPCKVIFVGDVAIGKTAIVSRFCYEKFSLSYKATIGVDFEVENFNILKHDFTLEMWDTAGQERFKCIAQAYYRNANAIVCVYDMSKLETLDHVKTWYDSAMAVNTNNKPLVFLVGTKSDLLSQADLIRVEKRAAVMAKTLNAEYWSVSARTGFKITEFFQRLAALSFERTYKDQMAHQKIADKAINLNLAKKSESLGFLARITLRRDIKERSTGPCSC